MEYGKQQLGSMNNDTAIKILWGGIVCYVIGFFLPQITVPLLNESISIWDILTSLGIMMMVASIGLTYYAITKAKSFCWEKNIERLLTLFKQESDE